jgi:hypothetical protein
MVFMADGDVLYTTNGNSVRYGTWDGSVLQDKGVVSVGAAGPAGTAKDGGISANAYIVESPVYVSASGDRLYALGAANNNEVYGLFDNGGGPHWEYLFSVPVLSTKGSPDQGIAAIASYSGNQLLIGIWGGGHGSAGGAVFAYPTGGGPGTLSLEATPGSNPYVPRIAVVNDALPGGGFEAYAIRNDDSTGQVYHTTTGESWTAVDLTLPGTMYFSLDVDRSTSPARVFVASDNAVYASDDQGAHWANVSKGLPKQPRCSDLRVVRQAGAAQSSLYLATYGWSVWKAALGTSAS